MTIRTNDIYNRLSKSIKIAQDYAESTNKRMLSRIEELGVVGAGGAGFPTAVKFRAQVPTFLINAAECEPLLHKDKELLQHHAEAMMRGLRIGMQCTGSKEAVIGIKEKYHDVIDSLQPTLPADVRIFPLNDSYPAGDEFILVHDITKRVIPPGGLPKDVGTVVVNVETLMNIGYDKPVTHKYLTIAGAVKNPVTLRLPVGITIREAIEHCRWRDGGRFRSAAGRRHDGQALRGSERTGHENARRHHCPAGGSSHAGPLSEDLEADSSHRQIGLRPVPFLHRYVPALFARPSHRASRRHAFTALRQFERATGCGDVVLLRVQPVHHVRVSGRSRSQECLRAGQARRARTGHDVQRTGRGYRCRIRWANTVASRPNA